MALFVLAVMRGTLVPGKERDYWRQAFFTEQETARQVTEQLKATDALLNTLRREVER